MQPQHFGSVLRLVLLSHSDRLTSKVPGSAKASSALRHPEQTPTDLRRHVRGAMRAFRDLRDEVVEVRKRVRDLT